MGFFDNLFGGAVELNKLANATANIISFLDAYEKEGDAGFLLTAAWMCKVGVTDRVEKNNWKSSHIVFVQIQGRLTKLTIMEVYMRTIYRLKAKAKDYWDNDLARIVDNILDGKREFFDIDERVPQEIRNVIS